MPQIKTVIRRGKGMEDLIGRKILELRQQGAFYRTNRDYRHAEECDRLANQWERERKEMRG